MEEQVGILEHRLAISPSFTLFDHILDDIHVKRTNSSDSKAKTTHSITTSFVTLVEQVNELKQDMIYQQIESYYRMIENYAASIHMEKQKLFRKRSGVDHKIQKMKFAITNAIETRRLHLLKRANYIIEHKKRSNFRKQ